MHTNQTAQSSDLAFLAVMGKEELASSVGGFEDDQRLHGLMAQWLPELTDRLVRDIQRLPRPRNAREAAKRVRALFFLTGRLDIPLEIDEPM